MALLVDDARWPLRGRMFAHLVSDVSLAELHAFAARIGVPRRAFQGDHYDLPAAYRARAVRAGARAVASRDVVLALRTAGLRTRRRRPCPERAEASPDVAPGQQKVRLGSEAAGKLDLA